MSYLQFPRLIFSGKFQADPPTVNNDPEHFNTATFQPNYDLPGAGVSNGWWNPKGTGAWRFKDCSVQQVQYSDGTICDDSALDPVVGMPINSVVDRVEGKLVDLDAEQQMVSAIWGFQVFLGSKGGDIGFGGDMQVCSFGDIWARFPKGQPDSFFGAYYQSIVDLTKSIIGSAGSRFLQDLQDAMGTGMQLSIRFNVDSYNDDMTTADFTFGRVTGAIGVYYPGEPAQFVSGRVLLAQPGTTPGLNTAYGLVQGNSLHLDLGNSLPTSALNGPILSFGNLYVATTDASGKQVIIGEIDYSNPTWYEKTAGIVSLPLNANQQTAIANNPIVLMQPAGGGAATIFASESADGTFVRADQFVFRFNPPETIGATLYATKFGLPYPSQTISFCIDNTLMESFVVQAPGMIPGPPVGVPASALSFPGSGITETSFQIETNEQGIATLSIHATDPGNPRGYIDGQVYGITYQLGATAPPLGSVQNPSQLLNLLVFNAYTIPQTPTWIADVQPIFQQYADLYPVMKRIVDLSNFGSVMQQNHMLLNVFNTPISNPNYMPVTRDLSAPKQAMLLQWLANPVYFDTNSVSQLMQALQIAIELEHSTIPPYLTAMYSIKQGANAEVADLIKSVVIEEMLHMALVCNILISIGGSPAIGQPGFIPNYPGSLPGGLRLGLTVELKKASIDHIRDCFMDIETPEEMLVERMKRIRPGVHLRAKMAEKAQAAGKVNGEGRVETETYTIGWFYDQLKKSLTVLSNSGAITFGNADKQVTQWRGTGTLYVIQSLQDALDAIDEIKDQGEGCNFKDPNDADAELSHYYKFSEIVEGRQLVKAIGGGYGYTGAKIPFDPAGVWNMVDNPSLVTYPDGSRAKLLSDQFTESYQALLASLHTTFNGYPDNISGAFGAMYSMGLQAVELMQTPSGLADGTMAGPQFIIPS